MPTRVLDYIEKNKDRFLENLKELLRIESISTQPAKKSEVLKCANLEIRQMKEIGLENVRLIETAGHPMVYGDWLHAEGKPTILIYGHYDVQPPDPLDEWKTPPFEPTIIDGNIYGRGTTDNKGQHFAHLCAIEAYLKTLGKLPVNVKIILEGEEECGSSSITQYVSEQRDFLKCDAVLISDFPWHDFEHPTIEYAIKGLVYCELRVQGATHDLHSGLFGGMVRNPVQALSWILSKLKDENEKILIPHFYDDVKALTTEEKKELGATLNADEQSLLKETGVSALVSEKGYTTAETNGRRPTLDVCGIWGGYQDVGAKTIIPAKAGAKVSIRLVANQDAKKVEKQFVDYVKSICPKGVTLEFETFHGCGALTADRNNFFVKETAGAFAKAFGKEVVYKAGGGSIPVATAMQEVLKAPVILIGLGLPDDRLHSPNEKFALKNFFGGIKGAALALEAFGKRGVSS